MIQMNECEGIFAARCRAEMNITLDRGKDRLFNKHDSSVVGKLTRLLTFDKQPLHTGYLMQLTAFGGELIWEIIGRVC